MRKLTTKDFVNRAKSIHGDKYDYSKVEYVNNTTKVCIICPKHGYNMQIPANHYTGVGCTECGKEFLYKVRSENKLRKKFDGLVQPEEYKLIPLTKGKFAIVDNEDFDRVSKINWYYSKGYAWSDREGALHRIINNTPEYKFTDHINHNTLDNRRGNLRTCTLRENIFNSRGKIGTSKYKGVSWSKEKGKWRAEFKRGEVLWYEMFETEEEAAHAYNEKLKILKNEFDYLNEIE